jgi:hypothetical protein
MQSQNFSIVKDPNETFEKRIWRIQYKWLCESEIWLTFLIIIELM